MRAGGVFEGGLRGLMKVDGSRRKSTEAGGDRWGPTDGEGVPAGFGGLWQGRSLRKYAASFAAPAVVALPVTGLLEMFERYVYADWEFLRFLFILFALDTVAGVWWQAKRRNLSSRGFGRIFVKLTIYGMLLVMAHVFDSFTVHGERVPLSDWFGNFICTALLVKEAFSIVEKLDLIYPGVIPKGLRERFRGLTEGDGEGRPGSTEIDGGVDGNRRRGRGETDRVVDGNRRKDRRESTEGSREKAEGSGEKTRGT
jgi:phage-related holin